MKRVFIRKEIQLLRNALWHLQFMKLPGHRETICPKEVDEGDVVALMLLNRALRGIEL